MKIKLVLIGLFLVVLNIFLIPLVNKMLFNAEYKLLEADEVEVMVRLEDDFELYHLNQCDLIRTQRDDDGETWKAFSTTDGYSMWVKRLEREQQIFFGRGLDQFFYTKKETTKAVRKIEGTEDLYKFTEIAYNLFSIDAETGRSSLEKYILSPNKANYSIDLSGHLILIKETGQDTPVYHIADAYRVSDVRAVFTEGKRGSLPTQQQVEKWEKTVENWDYVDCFEQENKLYYAKTNKIYELEDWRFRKISLPNYWVIVYEINGDTPMLRIAVFEKKIPSKLLDTYQIARKKIDDIQYSSKGLLIMDHILDTATSNKSVERALIFVLPNISTPKTYIGAEQSIDSKIVPNSTWRYQVLNDTIMLHDIASKKNQKIVFPHESEYVQAVRMRDYKWVIYIKEVGKMKKYVVPLAEVPTK